MKFQDTSFNGLKVTVGTKSVTHARSKSNMPYQLFQSWGQNQRTNGPVSAHLISGPTVSTKNKFRQF